MADFDRSGFAAVDEFFGRVDCAPSNAFVSESSLRGGGKKRLGVGGAATTPAAPFTEALTSKRILQVGSKRRRRQGFGDDHDHGEDGIEDAEQPKSDEEEEVEEGRTTIDNKKKTAFAILAESAHIATKSIGPGLIKKKKMGKKERQIHAESNELESQEETVNTRDNDDVIGHEKKKRKRRKVRSRQKNIRKDNRDVKPAHLIPGQGRYLGRPLSEETRARLNMPTIVKSPFAGDVWHGNDDDNDDNDHSNKRHANEGSSSALDAMPLAIDNEMLRVKALPFKNQNEDGEDLDPRRSSEDDAATKNKKKKYKNL